MEILIFLQMATSWVLKCNCMTDFSMLARLLDNLLICSLCDCSDYEIWVVGLQQFADVDNEA